MVTVLELSLLRYLSVDNIYVGFYPAKQLSFINTILINNDKFARLCSYSWQYPFMIEGFSKD